jgi:hypothetical protein
LSLDAGLVLKLRDKAFKQHKRRFANYVVAVIHSVLSWALDRGRSDNKDTGSHAHNSVSPSPI